MEMVEMRKYLIILILIAFTIPCYAVTIYKWVDKDGVMHFTDDYSKVPPQYRDQVKIEEKKDVKEEKPPLEVREPSKEPEERKKDIYGQDENYWRERVRPWKMRLKEAQANYEIANKKYMEKSEELSRRRFGSRTQYKMDIIELDRLNEERRKYQAQITEANEALKKITKEAEEAKANPDWLN